MSSGQLSFSAILFILLDAAVTDSSPCTGMYLVCLKPHSLLLHLPGLFQVSIVQPKGVLKTFSKKEQKHKFVFCGVRKHHGLSCVDFQVQVELMEGTRNELRGVGPSAFQQLVWALRGLLLSGLPAALCVPFPPAWMLVSRRSCGSWWFVPTCLCLGGFVGILSLSFVVYAACGFLVWRSGCPVFVLGFGEIQKQCC